MISSLLPRRTRDATSLIYAIGDVHGCYELVRSAQDRIRRHARQREHQMIFLGDYIDRGVKVRRTIENLMTLEAEGRAVCLRGNHEQMLLHVLRQRSAKDLEAWLEYGGRATARSYGAFMQLEELARYIPSEHVRWFSERPLSFQDEHRAYVHAGVDPLRAFDDQDEADLLWIRDRFLAAPPASFVDPRHVVHGHTMQWRQKPDPRLPELLAHRTNLDTGAYATGILTVGVFPSDRGGGPADVLSIS